MNLFGGGPSITDTINEVTSNPFFQPKVPKYPGGGFTTSSGGGFNQGVNRFAKLKPGLANKIISGKKFKNLANKNPDLFEAIKSDPTKIDRSLFSSNPKILGKAKKFQDPTFDVTASPESEALFNKGLDFAGQKIDFQSQLLPMLMGLQGSVFNQAQGLIDSDLTGLSDEANAEIDAAQQAFLDENLNNLDLGFERQAGILSDVLGESGFGAGGSGGGLDSFRGITRDDSLARASVANNAGIFGEQLRQNRLGEKLNAFNALASSANFNNAIGGDINPTYLNPTGQFDFNTLLNQVNAQNNYALQREQIRQAPGLAAIPGAISAANQPGFLEGLIGAVGGAYAGSKF